MSPARRLRIVPALLAAVVAGGAAPAPKTPMRIMSMNMCADLLVLQLVPKARIVSVSFLAPQSDWAFAPGLADGVATNRGTAEEVAALRPDMILVGDVSTPAVRRLAREIAAPVVEVRQANSFAEIRQVVRALGAAVGEPARAEALVARMDATLADLAAHPPARRVTVAAWSGDSVPGKGSLPDAIFTAAGAVNIAARLPDNRYSTFDLEQLLQARPDALLYGGGRNPSPSLRRDQIAHPVLRKLYAGRRIAYPDPLYACGLPQSADAARALREALAGLPPRP